MLPDNKPYLTKGTLWLMAVGAGLVVANNYYNQPLLGMIAKELGETEAATSKIAMFTQIGTTLTFRLEQAPFFQGSDVAGSLGLAGIVGAVAATYTGYISGKINKNILIVIACALMIASWGIIYLGDGSYVWLILGIIILDMGLQAMHVTNQTIVFSTRPESSNRLNTVYMVSYFIGGSFGTLVGGQAWKYYGWNGVIAVGAIFVILCLGVHLVLRKKNN